MKPSDLQVGGNHYKDFAIQPSEFIHRNGIGFLEGNIIKYVCRHRAKHGRQDLEKARHYLDLLLQWEYATDNETAATSGVPVAGVDGRDAGDPRSGPGVSALMAARNARRG